MHKEKSLKVQESLSGIQLPPAITKYEVWRTVIDQIRDVCIYNVNQVIRAKEDLESGGDGFVRNVVFDN